MCILYPILIGFELTTVPSILASELLESFSLYIALGVATLATVYACVVKPYDEKLNNIRLIAHRILMNLMVVVMIVSKAVITSTVDPDSPATNIVWVILTIILLGFLINFPFVIRRLALWVKREGLIDMKLFLKEKDDANK